MTKKISPLVALPSGWVLPNTHQKYASDRRNIMDTLYFAKLVGTIDKLTDSEKITTSAWGLLDELEVAARGTFLGKICISHGSSVGCYFTTAPPWVMASEKTPYGLFMQHDGRVARKYFLQGKVDSILKVLDTWANQVKNGTPLLAIDVKRKHDFEDTLAEYEKFVELTDLEYDVGVFLLKSTPDKEAASKSLLEIVKVGEHGPNLLVPLDKMAWTPVEGNRYVIEAGKTNIWNRTYSERQREFKCRLLAYHALANDDLPDFLVHLLGVADRGILESHLGKRLRDKVYRQLGIWALMGKSKAENNIRELADQDFQD